MKKYKAKNTKKRSWWNRLVNKPKKTTKKVAKRKSVKRKANGITVRVNKLPKYIYLTQTK